MYNIPFNQEDLESFMSRGFEVYKSSNGRYKIKPTVVETSARWEEAVKNAKTLGIELNQNFEIVTYNKGKK